MGSMGFAWKVAWLAWAFVLIRVIAALAAAAPRAPAPHTPIPRPPPSFEPSITCSSARA